MNYFISRMRIKDISHKAYLTFIGLIVIVGSVIPLFFSFGTWLPKFNNLLLTEQNISLYTLLSLFFGYIILKKTYQYQLSMKMFASIITLLTLVGLYFKINYIFSYEQDFYSDFRTMWNYAISIYNNGFIYPDRPQTERSLAFLVPLVQIFGTSEIVFKIFNVFMIMISSLIFIYIISQTISKHAAILFLIIIISVPEVYFASLIPTHDISATFYLSLYLLIVYKISTNIKFITNFKLLLFVLLLGIIGLLLDVNRGTFTVTILVLFIYMIVYFIHNYNKINKTIIIKLLLVLFLPLLIQSSIKTALIDNKYLVDYEYKYFGNAPSFVFPHTYVDGSFGNVVNFWRQYGAEHLKKDFDSLNYMKKALIYSDLYYNITEKPLNYLLRSQRLYQLGTQGGFYYGRIKNITKDEQLSINKFNINWNAIFTTLYLLVLFIATIYFIFSRYKNSKNIIYFPILFMSLATMALLLIGENQPRYLFMGWFLWSVVIVWFVDELFSKKDKNADSKDKEYLFSFKGLISLVGIALVLYFLFRLIFSSSDYKLIDMSQWKDIRCNEITSKDICAKAIVPFKHSLDDKYYSTLIMQLPKYPSKGDFVSNEKIFTVDKSNKYIFSTYIMSPYFREDGKKGFFDVNIYVNGEKKYTENIADKKGYNYLKIEDIKPDVDGNIKIELQIYSNIDYKTDSWQKASKVYFKFASLRESKNNE